MIERYATANVIAKLLALRPSHEPDRETILSSGLPPLFKNGLFLDAIDSLAPGQTVLEAFKALSNGVSGPVTLDSPIVKIATRLAPGYKDVIEGTVVAYLDNPASLKNSLSEALVPKVTQVISEVINPDQLVRCPTCQLPYYSNGQTGCPHC